MKTSFRCVENKYFVSVKAERAPGCDSGLPIMCSGHVRGVRVRGCGGGGPARRQRQVQDSIRPSGITAALGLICKKAALYLKIGREASLHEADPGIW